jgi:hypothetical protein
VPETAAPLQPLVEIYSPTGSEPFVQGFPSSTLVFYECISYVSAIISCQGDQPLLAPVDTSVAGTRTLTVRAVDAAGRTATATVTYQVVDFTPPVAGRRKG